MSKVGSCPDIISNSLVGIFWTSASLYYSFCLCQRIQVGLLSWEVVACERRVVVVDLITAALAFVYMLLWTYSAVIESEQKQPVFFQLADQQTTSSFWTQSWQETKKVEMATWCGSLAILFYNQFVVIISHTWMNLIDFLGQVLTYLLQLSVAKLQETSCFT